MATRDIVANRFLLPNTAQKSLFLDGVAGYATSDIVPSVNGFYLSFWLKALSGAGAYAHYKSASTTDGFFIFRASADRINAQIHNVGTLVANIASDVTSFQPSKFYFVEFLYLPNNTKMFVDLSQAGSTDTSCVMTEATYPLTFGKNSHQSANYAKCNMSRITILNATTMPTDAERADLYWRNIIPTGATQWSLNDTLLDQNGQNALTASGTSFVSDAPLQPRSAV